MSDRTTLSVAVLAGGLGTRLRPAVGDLPKVLAPVGGRPFLCRLLDQLRDQGVREALLLVGHRAGQVREAMGEGYRGLRLTYSSEEVPLGTGGAVRHALPLLRGDVLLLNGDSYCGFELAALRRRPGVGMVLARVADARRFGLVEWDGERVRRFAEKDSGAGEGWINAGVYLLPRDRLAALPAGPASLERDWLPAWVADGAVFGVAGGRFLDVGTPESYAAAEAFFDGVGVPAGGRPCG